MMLSCGCITIVPVAEALPFQSDIVTVYGCGPTGVTPSVVRRWMDISPGMRRLSLCSHAIPGSALTQSTLAELGSP